MTMDLTESELICWVQLKTEDSSWRTGLEMRAGINHNHWSTAPGDTHWTSPAQNIAKLGSSGRWVVFSCSDHNTTVQKGCNKTNFRHCEVLMNTAPVSSVPCVCHGKHLCEYGTVSQWCWCCVGSDAEMSADIIIMLHTIIISIISSTVKVWSLHSTHSDAFYTDAARCLQINEKNCNSLQSLPSKFAFYLPFWTYRVGFNFGAGS